MCKKGIGREGTRDGGGKMKVWIVVDMYWGNILSVYSNEKDAWDDKTEGTEIFERIVK